MRKIERGISIILLVIIGLSNISAPVSYAAEQAATNAAQKNPQPLDTSPVPPPAFKHPDKGSVLGTSTSLFEIGTQEGIQTSASKRVPLRMQRLEKKVYEVNENVALAVTNPDNDPFTTTVVDTKGQPAPVPLTESNDGTTTTVQLIGSNQIKPGRYTIKITDRQGNVTSQDFSWGVLALNTDKSIYTPGEKANISLAVLNDKGDMVCDAKLTLEITNQQAGIDETLSTDNKKIQTNEQCQKHDFSLQPDYEAQYQFTSVGTYNLALAAVTGNGTHSMTQTIHVQNHVQFDVQRVSATRLYPPNTYPMTFNIKANRDFSGTITETVPEDFVITPATGSATTSYNNMQTVYLNSNDPAAQLQQAIAASSSGGLTMPFQGNYPITQGFGAQMTDPTLQAFYTHYGLAGHDGIDFGVPMNTPLYAVDDGSILEAGPGDYGTTIIIQHAWGESYYGHLSTTAVNVGSHVTKGQLIGYSGESGEATGPHLHFGMKPLHPDTTNGYYGKVDPLPYIPYENQQSQSISSLNPTLASAPTSAVLSASDSATTDPTASDSSSQPVSPTVVPTAALTGVITPTPAISQPVTTSAPTSVPPPAASVTPAPLFQIENSQATTNSKFTVLDKQILLSEQLANNADTEKVKVITWDVTLKKGDTTSLGYDYQIPHTSPQYYVVGPLQFYQKGSNNVVFQEQRQWEIASDDVGVDWYSNTTGNRFNGYSWLYRKKITIDHTKVVYNPTVDFMDSGGDATNTNGGTNLTTTTGGFYNATSGTVAYDTATKETGPGSLKFTSGGAGAVATVNANGILADTGRRISTYYNFTNLPTANLDILMAETSGAAKVFTLQVTSGGVLQLTNGSGTQIGSNGSTLSTGTWYRISVAYTITSTSTYSIKVYVNGIQSISVSNSTALANSSSNELFLGWGTASVGNSKIMNVDDVYVDSGLDLSDTGDIHVTAKRPNANGSANQFSTSGTPAAGTFLGNGTTNHWSYTSERPLNTGALLTVATNNKIENFTVEGASAGDVDVSSATILATGAWIYAKGSAACQVNGTTVNSNAAITNNGWSSAVALSTTPTMFTSYRDASAYPSGNQAVGMTSCNGGTAVTTSLYEAGVQVAYSTSSITAPTFPVLINLSSDSDLSGSHTQSSGADILFTDSTGRNLLTFDLESYNNSTGSLQAWVNTPLSVSADTILYMYYGNPSASSQANASNVWDSNFKGLWHMYENSGTTTHDSTSNANTGTLSGTGGPGWTTGQIGNAINFTGSNANQIDNAGSGSSLDNLTSGFTVEAWINTGTNTIDSQRAIVVKTDASTLGSGWFLFYNGLDTGVGFQAIYSGSSDLAVESTPISLNTWLHVVATWDGSNSLSNVHLYINGTEVSYLGATNGIGTYGSDAANSLTMGQYTDKVANNNFVGSVDEVRVSNAVRSNGWIQTEYNNQSNPGAGGFMKSLGSVETDIYAPTLSQIMRHGEFFNTQGAIQPFVF